MLFKNFLLETISITALPTDIAKGLPPKVDPCEPAIIPDATFLFIKTAPIGNPPPIPFAIGTISGFTFGDHNSLKKRISKNTAAIMVETIMGEGGIKVIPDWCLRDLRKLCNKKKILLILDEVQCGIGRSGDFFAFESSKVKPDIVPIAKGIGGGFPIGAVLMNKKVS